MANIDIDADKIKAAGENIKGLANEYNKVVEELYLKMKNIENDGLWASGPDGSSKRYIARVMMDKPAATSLAVSMNELGNKIVDYANSINNISGNRL